MRLRFNNVTCRALGTALPAEEIPSLEIERRLAMTYERLGLIGGRLELMTGIASRRHFPAGTLPSDIAAEAASDLFSRVPQLRETVDCLIHASVCRDLLEPATATAVHRKLGLSPSCLVFDLSNACLSWVNAWIVAAGLIESGQVKNALIVCGEDARAIVDSTVAALNGDLSLTRHSLKRSLASLTLGSGGAAALLTKGQGARVLGGSFSTATEFNDLCKGTQLMETESTQMLKEGVALAAATWQETRQVLDWKSSTPAIYFTHQVGSAHRSLMIEKLELDPTKDFSTFNTLGNMGAASVGLTLALGARADRIRDGDPVALLGIGSGLVCGMLGLEWSAEVAV